MIIASCLASLCVFIILMNLISIVIMARKCHARPRNLPAPIDVPIPTKAPVCNGIMPPGDSGIMAPSCNGMIPPGRRVS